MPTLYGPDGQPIDKRKLTEALAAPTVSGIRTILGGHPSAGLTPARLASVLRQAIEGEPDAYLELAEDMEEKDLHYLAVLSTRKRQVAQLEITVKAAGEDQASLDQAALVKQWLSRDSLEDELVDMLDAVAKGFSVMEIVWETSTGSWLPRELVWRDPRWFRFDRVDGQSLLLRTDEAPQGESLAPWKFVVHQHKAKSGLPIRGGLARACCWLWLFKNFDVKAWISFTEAFGQPLRLGKYGPEATEQDKRVLMRAVSEIARDAAAIVPTSMQIEFVEAKLSGNADLFERHADWIDRQISKAVLGQTTTTDAVSGGHSVAQEHDKVREDIERADARQLAGTLNRAVVRPLIELNFGPQAAYPQIQIGRPEEIDTAGLVDALAKLVPLGLRVGQAPLRDLLRLPAPEDGEELLGASGVEAPDATKPEKRQRLSTTAKDSSRVKTAGAGTDQPDPIERLLSDLAASGDLGDAMQPITGPLQRIAAEAGDYQTFQARLAKHLAGADVTRIAELIARASFFGTAAGRAGSAIEVDNGDG